MNTSIRAFRGTQLLWKLCATSGHFFFLFLSFYILSFSLGVWAVVAHTPLQGVHFQTLFWVGVGGHEGGVPVAGHSASTATSWWVGRHHLGIFLNGGHRGLGWGLLVGNGRRRASRVSPLSEPIIQICSTGCFIPCQGWARAQASCRDVAVTVATPRQNVVTIGGREGGGPLASHADVVAQLLLTAGRRGVAQGIRGDAAEGTSEIAGTGAILIRGDETAITGGTGHGSTRPPREETVRGGAVATGATGRQTDRAGGGRRAARRRHGDGAAVVEKIGRAHV